MYEDDEKLAETLAGPGISDQCNGRTRSGITSAHWSKFFLSFYFLGWVPPTSTNHRLQAQRVGPAHKLFSVIYATIPSRRPSVKDIVGYVKKFISFYFGRGSCIMSLNILYKIN